MKLTYLTGYYYPERTADVHLNRDLVEGLSERGVDVTLITSFPVRNVPDEIQTEYAKKKDETVSDTLRIIRIGKPMRYKNRLFSRGLFLLRKTRLMYTAAKKTSADVYLITSTPPFLGYAASALSKRKPVIYLMQDVFPDSLIRTKNLNPNGLFVKLLRKAEKRVYRNCRSLVAVSDDMRDTLVANGANPGKISVIYDWIDSESCVPVEKDDNPLYEKFGIPKDKFTVCYAGNIGPLQNTEIIVDAASLLKKECENIQFVIVGDGSHEKELDEYIRQSSCENIIRLPMQKLEDVSYVYSLGDVGLVTLKSGITKYALPSKTWSIMSAGRAVACSFDKNSALARIITENSCGLCSEAEDAEGLAQLIKTLYSDRALTEKMGKNGRAFVEMNLSKENAVSKYAEIISECCDNGTE